MPTSYKFVGTTLNGRSGFAIEAGDTNADGIPDLLIGAQVENGGAGAVYLVSGAELATADALDGTVDGEIALSNIQGLSDSYRFLGENALANVGQAIASAGDIDNDGMADLVIGSSGAIPNGPTDPRGTVYVISADDLLNADMADGFTDGEIDLGNVAAQANSFQITSEGDARIGRSVGSAGDVDNDGRDDLLIGAGGNGGAVSSGQAYMIRSSHLALADSADGTDDGVLTIANAVDEVGSYRFVFAETDERGGNDVVAAGDVDGDGIDDFLISAPENVTNGGPGNAYFVSGGDLATLDAADGMLDGSIQATNIAGGMSYQFAGFPIGMTNSPGTGDDISAGDFNGDGKADFAIGNFTPGGVQLINGAFLETADTADGTNDNIIDLSLTSSIPGSYQINPPTTPAGAGRTVSFAGDVDGDGLEDLLFGISFRDGGALLLSSSDLDAADLADGVRDNVIDGDNIIAQPNSYQFVAEAAFDNVAQTLSAAGDVDGDGFGDFLIGAVGNDPNGVQGAGATYLLSGADLAAADDDGTGEDGIINLASIGYDGFVEGTANADFIDAFYLGDPQLDRVDNNDNAAGTNDDIILAGSGDDTIVASLGDDEILGEGGDDTYLSGNLGTSYTFVGANSGDFSGRSVASAGDVDGDGVVDLIIGASNSDSGGPGSGEAYLISGAELDAADAADGTVDRTIDLGLIGAQPDSYRFVGIDAGDGAGVSVTSVGDVDGDGFSDVLIGARRGEGLSSTGTDEGEAYLVTSAGLASADVADGVADGVIDLENIAGQSGSYQFLGGPGDLFLGNRVSSAGDVDGDGLDDLLIGAPESTHTFGSGADEGASYVIASADLSDADLADGVEDGVIDLSLAILEDDSYRFVGGSFDQELGFGISSLGDLDGDGFDDLLLGAREGDQPGQTDPGTSFIVSGAELSNLDAFDGFADGVIDVPGAVGQPGVIQFAGESANDRAGTSVSSAGDVDGDGIVDLLIGAAELDDGGFQNTGGAYLVSGAEILNADLADGLADGDVALENVTAQSNSYQFIGSLSDDQSGWSVASAGDVDGDGLDDILIGSLLGNVTYLVASADLEAADLAGGLNGVIELEDINEQSNSYVFSGASPTDQAGRAVNAAGDLDGDGLGDFLIGAPGVDGGPSGSGETYLISGRDLAALDAVDGTEDGVINLGLTALVDDTIDITINNDGDGFAVGQYVTGFDTLTSVERFVAGENPDEADTINITNGGGQFATVDISNIDDTATGTFTATHDNATITFGPSAGLTFSEVVDGIDDRFFWQGGLFEIAGGDESGTVGNIDYENFEFVNFSVACFLRDTKITTDKGPILIQDLRPGDRVFTMDHGYCPIRWIGSSKVDPTMLAIKPKLRPILIRSGSLAKGCPEEDLRVSPQHRVLVRSAVAQRMFGEREVLISANKLLPIDGVEVEKTDSTVEYFHILFDEHEIIFSNGAPTESLFTGPEAMKSVPPEARKELLELFPDLTSPDFISKPARTIPDKGRRMKKLVERHQVNEKPLLQL